MVTATSRAVSKIAVPVLIAIPKTPTFAVRRRDATFAEAREDGMQNKNSRTETTIDWQAVLLVYMRHVYEADHIVADPDYGMTGGSGATNPSLEVPGHALEWLRTRYREMLQADGMG